jgi:uncharacterized protein (TIGR02145 family)
MKKLLLLLTVAVGLFACSKKQETQSPVTGSNDFKKVAVKFNVSGFSQITGPIASAKDKAVFSTRTNAFTPIRDNFINDKLIYVVYDSQGKEVSRLEQFKTSDPGKVYRIANDTKTLVSSNSTFGTLSDNLNIGTYTVVVMVGQTDASFNRIYEGQVTTDFPKAYPTAILDEAAYYPTSGDILDDSFYYKGSLNVTTDSKTQSIVLDRIVGKLIFNIEDVLPANAYELTYDITTENTYFKLGNNTPGGTDGYNGHTISSVVFNARDIGKANFRWSEYILNTVTPMTVVLTISDINHKTLGTKTITNVRVSKNEQTTLTGKIFQATTNNFGITLNQQWGSNPNVISFNPTNNKVTIGGSEYNTAVIGTQTWTTVNYNGAGGLNYDNGANDAVYGKLYNHADIASLVLPSGWRIPSAADCQKLMSAFGQVTTSGIGLVYINDAATTKMRAVTGWQNTGTDIAGFSAYPAGYAYSGKGGWNFTNRGQSTIFLTSTDAADYSYNGDSYKQKYGFNIDQSNIIDEHGGYRGVSNTARLFAYNVATKYSLRFVKDN